MLNVLTSGNMHNELMSRITLVHLTSSLQWISIVCWNKVTLLNVVKVYNKVGVGRERVVKLTYLMHCIRLIREGVLAWPALANCWT